MLGVYFESILRRLPIDCNRGVRGNTVSQHVREHFDVAKSGLAGLATAAKVHVMLRKIGGSLAVALTRARDLTRWGGQHDDQTIKLLPPDSRRQNVPHTSKIHASTVTQCE